MGENAKKIGEKLEEFSRNYLLTHFGWQELLRDYEIKCARQAHKNPAGNKKRTHGIDLLSKFADPYFGGQAVLIECKNRQMQSITASSVNGWVQEIINNVECAQSATELKDANIDTSVLSTGLLIIHANDSTHSDYQIDDILKGLSAPNRRNPINIFIATNRELSMWTSMFQFIENTFNTGDFMFVYPSINNMGKEHLKHISINSLYSKYVFAQHKYPHEYVDGNRKITETKESNIMFSFDDISMDSFRYMWSMFKYYQMQGSNDYKFCFYPRKSADTQLLTKENFINAIIQDDVELTDSDKVKINLLRLDNRALSPVDTMGGNGQ